VRFIVDILYWSRFLSCRLGVRVMSLSSAEVFLRNAKQQISQTDINNSLLQAVAELAHEVKRLDDEVRRARRDVQVSRRF